MDQRNVLRCVHKRFQFFFFICSCVSLFVLAVKYCDNKNLKNLNKQIKRRKRTKNTHSFRKSRKKQLFSLQGYIILYYNKFLA